MLSGSYDYTLRIFDFSGMKSDLRAFRSLEPCEGHPVMAVGGWVGARTGACVCAGQPHLDTSRNQAAARCCSSRQMGQAGGVLSRTVRAPLTPWHTPRCASSLHQPLAAVSAAPLPPLRPPARPAAELVPHGRRLPGGDRVAPAQGVHAGRQGGGGVCAGGHVSGSHRPASQPASGPGAEGGCVRACMWSNHASAQRAAVRSFADAVAWCGNS